MGVVLVIERVVQGAVVLLRFVFWLVWGEVAVGVGVAMIGRLVLVQLLAVQMRIGVGVERAGRRKRPGGTRRGGG